jgi:DNA-binding Lrp family transcriptional regulator
MLQQTRLDNTDLQIIRILSRDPRSPYRTIGPMVGISTHAAVTTVKKMLAKGVIQSFNVVANPAIFGYEKECILII